MKTSGIFLTIGALILVGGCRSAQQHRQEADQAANNIIQEKQQQALGRQEPFTIETPADTLRRRLMLDQHLQRSGPASLGTRDLQPIKYWPNDDYLDPAKAPPATMPAGYRGGALHLDLIAALQVAAYNSRDYQARKEAIFIDALALELERDDFRTSFAAVTNSRTTLDLGGQDAVAGVVTTPDLSASQRFASGAAATVGLALDLAKLLTQGRHASYGVAADFSISQPLMRGFGKHIVLEPLTQAERNVAYDLLEFEQFKRSFAVTIITSYYGVLEQFDRLENAANNYKRVIRATRWSRAMADTGRLSEIQYDQAYQQELSARDGWIAAQQNVQRSLDTFKITLGLPPDAQVALDLEQLPQLRERMLRELNIVPPAAISDEAATQPAGLVPGDTAATRPVSTPPATRPSTTQAADQDIDLLPPTRDGAGRFELPEDQAIRLALENRPDLRVAHGEVFDAQRRVVVTADALRAGLTITVAGAFGERRSLGSTSAPDADLRPEKGSYSLNVNNDLPLERTAQQNSYRASLINLERATRTLQQREDEIKLAVRNQLRVLLQARESLKTQSLAVALARRRVDSTEKFLKEGRGIMRDVLDAQASLLSAENQFTSSLVDYRLAELELQRDLGLLEVNYEGLLREYSPEVQTP